MAKLTENLMDSVFTQPNTTKQQASKDLTVEVKKWGCTHCHGDFHTGGSAKCPLKDDETKVARLMAKKINKRISSGETDKDKIITEVHDAK
jgi:hypothetical protein